uniref:Polygalacturonase inhibitor 2-like n=1 Tax=Cicer arietinum TaxID=3827 RepID=A0A3Q7XT13_CICAR|nr:polygalacturonase inhibitor 2-like [Cicer arietinum]
MANWDDYDETETEEPEEASLCLMADTKDKELHYIGSRNRLSGKIPASLANLNLAFLDLSRNALEGDASVFFGSKKETQQIVLGNNKFGFDFGKVGLSKNLEKLDLRNNKIYGTLPEGLTALKFLHKLNVSSNNLCGQIPSLRFDETSYAHNKCLCGSPLPPCKT